MNCRSVYRSLLALESPAVPDPEVREHLKGCSRCRRRRRRLLRLQREVQSLPFPLENPRAKACFLQMLARLQTHQAAAASAPPSVRPTRRRLVTYAVAAVLLLAPALGWLLGEKDDAPRPKKPAEAVASGSVDPVVVDRLLERHLHLAQGLPSGERFQVFVELAAELRDEALRLARQPGSAELPVVVRLYGRIMDEGLVGRAAHLNEPQRRQRLPAVINELRQTENQVQRAIAEASPSVAASLRSLAATARDARARLQLLLGEKV
jgi:hypothetical protein